MSLEDAMYQTALADKVFTRGAINFSIDMRFINDEKKDLEDDIIYKEICLLKEMEIGMSSSIFVRQDSKNQRRFSAIIFGSEGTEYDSCCIPLSILLPPDYPKSPPKVYCGISVDSLKFNPNIFTEGKLCLSILNTWGNHGSIGKWDPENSSLYQILVSIQSLVFTSDPYFNDSTKDHLRNTQYGCNENEKYNTRLRMIAVAEAIYNQLVDPPKGFEDVVKVHFVLKKEHLKIVMQDWLKDFEERTSTMLDYDYKMYKNKSLREWIEMAEEELEKLVETDDVSSTFSECDTIYMEDNSYQYHNFTPLPDVDPPEELELESFNQNIEPNEYLAEENPPNSDITEDSRVSYFQNNHFQVDTRFSEEDEDNLYY